jgi:hypothetical protein
MGALCMKNRPVFVNFPNRKGRKRKLNQNKLFTNNFQVREVEKCLI